MNKHQFLALTASDDWLTAEEMAARLDWGSYWTEEYRAGPPALRLTHVETQLRTLRTKRPDRIASRPRAYARRPSRLIITGRSVTAARMEIPTTMIAPIAIERIVVESTR